MELVFIIFVLFVVVIFGFIFFQTKNSNTLFAKNLQDAQLQYQELQQKNVEMSNQYNQELATVRSDYEQELNRFRDVNSRLTAELREQQTRLSIVQKQHIDDTATIDKYTRDNQKLSTELAAMQSNMREQKTLYAAKEEQLIELKQQFEKQKALLTNEFQVLSEKIIKQREQSLTEVNKQNVVALLQPLNQKIQDFQHRVNQVHSETVKGNSDLGAEIKKVLDIGLKMSDQANNLTSALKGDSQQRGAWGEAQLERTLEMSGLIVDEHFSKQEAFQDEDGKRKQTDYIVKLPMNKHIIIDSKVSLVDYEKAIATPAQDEKVYLAAMDNHVRSIRAHIDSLASKNYAQLSTLHSPSFVLMFMPIEPAYIEALKHDKSLFGYGYEKNIVLVSHTTLIPILRTVANLWMFEQSHKEVKNISDKAGEIYNSVCLVAERFQRLGNTLTTVNKQYNDTVTAISGNQGLTGKVERFTKISKKADKKLPHIDPVYLQHDADKLQIAVKTSNQEPQTE